MKKTTVRYAVEFHFIETRHGICPEYIFTFENEADAIAFAATKDDARIVPTTWTIC